MGKNKRSWQSGNNGKHQSKPKGPKYNTYHTPKYSHTMRRCLREDQVGITEYASKGAGFTGVVKSRFSDFHVNEIDRNGKVLHFNDMSVPKPAPESVLNEEEVTNAKSEFLDIITPDVWQRIGKLAAMNAKNPAAQPVEVNVTSLDKDKRTKIHNVLKQLYGSRVVTSTINQTIDSKEERFIKIMKPKGLPSERRKKWAFPGEYVHFLVYKENVETPDAASRIASNMRMHPSQVNYCGTKDKRAKTTQKFCIRRREPSQILTAAQMSKIRIGNFEFSNDVLKLGDLQGNRFRIALRHVSGDEKDIEESLANLRDNGFINYYGLQRFGNHADVPTYEVGVALLKADYKTVVELILKPREGDVPFMDEIRQFWWTHRNSPAAAAMFTKNSCIEKKLLDGLAQYGEHDYSTALRKIPRNVLILYPHAFQSLVFNRIASRRIKKFGLQIIPGDLVYRNKEELDEDIIENTPLENVVEDEEGKVEIEKPDVVADTFNNSERSENIANNDTKGNEIVEDEKAKVETENPDVAADTSENSELVKDVLAEENIDRSGNTDSVYKRKVKALTEEDIASGEYTIFDVVLPMPGYDITYPNNEIKYWYEEILQEYGLSSENLRHKIKSYSMGGTYRKLLIRPTNLSWKFRMYSNPEESLIASDWDHITGKAASIEKPKCNGKYKALVLDFCLPPSVYATMLLRELLRSDTSASNQALIENNEIAKKNAEKVMSKDNDNSVSAEKRKIETDETVEVEEKKSKLENEEVE